MLSWVSLVIVHPELLCAAMKANSSLVSRLYSPLGGSVSRSKAWHTSRGGGRTMAGLLERIDAQNGGLNFSAGEEVGCVVKARRENAKCRRHCTALHYWPVPLWLCWSWIQGCRLWTAEAADPSNFHRTTTNSFLSGGKAIRHRKILSILGCQHFNQTMSSIRGSTVNRSFASRKTLRICHSQRLPARRRKGFVCLR